MNEHPLCNFQTALASHFFPYRRHNTYQHCLFEIVYIRDRGTGIIGSFRPFLRQRLYCRVLHRCYSGWDNVSVSLTSVRFTVRSQAAGSAGEVQFLEADKEVSGL